MPAPVSGYQALCSERGALRARLSRLHRPGRYQFAGTPARPVNGADIVWIRSSGHGISAGWPPRIGTLRELPRKGDIQGNAPRVRGLPHAGRRGSIGDEVGQSSAHLRPLRRLSYDRFLARRKVQSCRSIDELRCLSRRPRERRKARESPTDRKRVFRLPHQHDLARGTIRSRWHHEWLRVLPQRQHCYRQGADPYTDGEYLRRLPHEHGLASGGPGRSHGRHRRLLQLPQRQHCPGQVRQPHRLQ